jgi:hypothetical protein
MDAITIMQDFAKDEIVYWNTYLKLHPGSEMTPQVHYAIKKLKELL